MPDVSVVISTYNRADSLRDTLQSLVGQNANGCRYEVIVVDNHSKDHTKKTVQDFAAKSPWPICYVYEPQQGVSYARNTGIRKAAGAVIAFTDDDVVTDPEWVQSLWRCFQETDASAVGGRIERLWHCQKPEWFSDEIGGSLIHQDLGTERRKWSWPNRHTVGANIAFRREVFERFGFFREDLGRCGESLVGGEDREMFQRLMKRGCPIYYEPRALVRHKVEKHRLSQDYMRRWYWHIGETLGHGMEWRWHHAVTVAPLWVWKEMVRAVIRKANARVPAERFASEMWVRHHGAMLKERLAHWLPFGLGSRWCAFEEKGKRS